MFSVLFAVGTFILTICSETIYSLSNYVELYFVKISCHEHHQVNKKFPVYIT